MPTLPDRKARIMTIFSLTMSIGILCSVNLSAKEYIIKPTKPLKHYNLSKLNSTDSFTIKVMDQIPDLNLVKIAIAENSDQADALIRAIEFFHAEYIVANIKLYSFLSVNDPQRSAQWALDKIAASETWDISLGSDDVVVAVVDTGIDINHEDLKDNVWINKKEIAGNGKDDDNNGYIDDIQGWDFKGNDKDPNDEVSMQNPGHGTHCSGIIGASCNNSLGICGMSPKVSLMPLRFLGSDGSGDLFDAVKAVDYAINNGAHVISASFGATVPEAGAQPLIDAIVRAEQKGVIFVAAAGNEGRSNDTTHTYPANTPASNMITVAASGQSDEKPSWSNYGRKVHVASPGVDILSTIPSGYDKLSGTSMATPLVAGLVALMKSLDINLSGIQTRSIIESTGDIVDIDTASSRRINARKALEAVRNKSLTLVPATATLEPNKTATFSGFGGIAPYRFISQNPAVATIDDTGLLTAKTEGDVVIEIIDAKDNKASSVSIRVEVAKQADESCPIDNDILCMILCLLKPDLPWCNSLANPLP